MVTKLKPIKLGVILVGIAAGLFVGITFTDAIAQGTIPTWVKILAGAWADGISSDQEFIDAMEFLIEAGAIQVSSTVSSPEDIPIGTVIDWWRPSSNTPLPQGYEICDGGVVNDPDSPLAGVEIPDLRNKFILGSDSQSGIGQSGGSSSHSHRADPPGVTTNSDSHQHEWVYFKDSNKNWYTYNLDGDRTVTLTNWSNGIDRKGAGEYPLDADSRRDYHLYTTLESHEHTLDITSQQQTGSSSNTPPYVGLLKIMRVK